MLIVFVALGLITLFIVLLPKALEIIAKIFPHKAAIGIAGKITDVEDNVIAAIGFALYKRITKDTHKKNIK